MLHKSMHAARAASLQAGVVPASQYAASSATRPCAPGSVPPRGVPQRPLRHADQEAVRPCSKFSPPRKAVASAPKSCWNPLHSSEVGLSSAERKPGWRGGGTRADTHAVVSAP